jgi:hypothetical protein
MTAEMSVLLRHLALVVAVACGLALFAIAVHAFTEPQLPIPWWGYFAIVVPLILLPKIPVIWRVITLLAGRKPT